MDLSKAPVIGIEQIDWEGTGPEDDPSAVLLGQLIVGGTPMHIEAIAVSDQDGEWEADDLSRGSVLTAVEEANGAKSQPTVIDGRNYVIWAAPFGA